MDLLKTATDWAKAELVSTPFFVLFGLVFITGSLGFWQFGKTEMAKAYVMPTLIAGVLLMIIGCGLFFTNKMRIQQFEKDYHVHPTKFLQKEIERSEATLKEYQNVVFTGIPILIAVCALALLFVKTPIWKTSLITSMAMLIVILLIDGTASARIKAYDQALKQIEKHQN